MNYRIVYERIAILNINYNTNSMNFFRLYICSFEYLKEKPMRNVKKNMQF